MNINDFQNLSREDQFAEAGRISGLQPAVFDGIWRTESGRGNAMLSPAGAEGHFGLMPKTRKTMEGRFGQPIDPMNFGQSLFTSAHLMKENMGRFKNVPDSLRAYNGGWTPSTWGNPETSAYAGKVLGDDTSVDANYSLVNSKPEERAAMQPSQLARSSAIDLWDMPYGRSLKGAKAAKPDKVASALSGVAAAISAPVQPPTAVVFGMSTDDAAMTTFKVDKDKKDTSLLDMTRAAAYSEPFNVFARYAIRDEEPVDPTFVPPEDVMKGKTDAEQSELRSATSKKQLDRMMLEMDYSKEQDSITFKNGTAWGIGATLIAELPMAILSGVGVTATLGKLGLGAMQAARAGHYGKALGLATLDGIIGNVGVTALMDSVGERQGATAYAMGVAGGMLNPLLMGRSIGTAVTRAAEKQTASRILAEAVLKEEGLMAKATERLGAGADPADLRRMMDEIEQEGVKADITSHKSAIPEERKMNVGEVEEVAVAPKAEAPAPVSAMSPEDDLSQLITKLKDSYGEKIKTPFEDAGYQDRQAMSARNSEGGEQTIRNLSGLGWKEVDAMPKGFNVTPSLEARMGSDLQAKNAVGIMRALFDEYMPKGQRLVINDGAVVGPNNAGTKATGGAMSLGSDHFITIDFDDMKGGARGWTNHVAMHELGHIVFQANAPLVPKEVIASLDGEWARMAENISKGKLSARADRLAVTNPGRFSDQPMKSTAYALSRTEFAAEQFVSHLQNRLLAGEFGKLNKTVIGQVLDGVKAVFNYAMGLLERGLVKPGKEFDKFFSGILKGSFAKKVQADEFLEPGLKLPTMDDVAASADIPDALAKDVRDFMMDPVALRHGLDRMPMGTPAERAEAKQVLALYKKAEAPEYVVDEKRLSWILSKVDALNPTSNTMLRSKNPVVRMAALELLENGGGAGGRRSTASIAKWMNERSIVGNTIVDLDQNFRTWFKTQPGASHLKEATGGAERSRFSRLVAEEIEQRRFPADQYRDMGDNVRKAADSVEGAFERARTMQVDAKTSGWGALPDDSRGYMPHRIKSTTYRNLTLAQKRGLHGELTDQFITGSEFDPTFADQLASRYLDRVEHRALGGFDAPMGIHQVGASDVVKEALEQMNMSRPEIDAAMKRYAAGGANHTKKRLSLDLRKEIPLDDGTSFRLMDLYDTDMLSLVRGQSQRVSGEVALARHGVMGKPGLAIMRRAMGYGGNGEQAVVKEIDSFDQISAEFLGGPFGASNKNVDRAMQLNSVMSLGGMGFNQLGEQINVGMTLGVKAALQNVTGFGRLRAEILAMAKGKTVDNGLLNSIETMGGAEFGTDAYKMVFPLDNPDLFANSLGGDSLHAGDRLLRGAGHLQSKLSLWRTINSVQVRGVAEQIVMKASRALKDGVNDYHLRDMGMTDELLARLKADMPNIAKYEGGKLVKFDITQATDKEAAHAFIQGVHRGASQIIQGNFIGESGKYIHSSWLRMLTQFRSFSLTAIDKQFNRQLANRGPMGAAFMTMGAMGLAAPIYMARTYAASVGRADQAEYLEQRMSFGAVARATTNYIATAGLGGDFLDAFTAITGTGEVTGGRSGTNSQLIGNLVAPVLGKADKLWGAVQNTKDGTDVHGLLRELPLARLPWFIPAINAMGN